MDWLSELMLILSFLLVVQLLKRVKDLEQDVDFLYRKIKAITDPKDDVVSKEG